MNPILGVIDLVRTQFFHIYAGCLNDDVISIVLCVQGRARVLFSKFCLSTKWMPPYIIFFSSVSYQVGIWGNGWDKIFRIHR